MAVPPTLPRPVAEALGAAGFHRLFQPPPQHPLRRMVHSALQHMVLLHKHDVAVALPEVVLQLGP